MHLAVRLNQLLHLLSQGEHEVVSAAGKYADTTVCPPQSPIVL